MSRKSKENPKISNPKKLGATFIFRAIRFRVASATKTSSERIDGDVLLGDG
jgi:hypothetical protein